MSEAEYGTGHTLRCIGCGRTSTMAFGNPNLSPRRVLMWCGHCAETFWNARAWSAVAQSPEALVHKPITCVGCESSVFKVYVNTVIPVPIAFCIRCQSQLMKPRLWEQFHRNVRDEDLAGYAPSVLGLGEGSKLRQR